jgi:predicted nucleic acid-binding protein
VPVVIETSTFLDRNANRDVALAWREQVYRPGTVKLLPCDLADLEQSWACFQRADLHKLSAVDATSFAIMKRARIRIAYIFNHHFSAVGIQARGVSPRATGNHTGWQSHTSSLSHPARRANNIDVV